MGRKRANLKGLTCSLTTPLFSQRPERTPGGHAPETRRGLRKDEVNGSAKRRRRHFERRARRSGGESFRITNNPEGHRALIKRLKGFDVARIVFEATGAYHRLFQQALVEVGLPWVKVNPCQARRFAQATGKLAKTDRCDALMLARMGAALDLETRAPASKTVEALKELVNARDALIKDRVA